jgi:hypothetical protein
MRLSQLFKSSVVIGFAITVGACASLTPEKIAKRLDTMNDFDLCLASSAEMDKFTFALPEEIVQAARERITAKKLDCTSKQEEIVRFLVKSLRDQEKRNEQFRTHFGFGFMRGW